MLAGPDHDKVAARSVIPSTAILPAEALKRELVTADTKPTEFIVTDKGLRNEAQRNV